MMLKRRSNKWGRLKLALLIPVGLAALSAFARPETEVVSPPAETTNWVPTPSGDKGTALPQDDKGSKRIKLETRSVRSSKDMTLSQDGKGTYTIYLSFTKTGNDGKEISTPLTTTLWKDSVAFMADEQPENATIHLSPARNATPLPESGEIDLYVKPTVRLYTIYDDKTVKLSTPIAVEFNHSVDVTKFENYLNTNPRLARRVYFLDVNEDGVLYSSGSSISD